MREEMNFGLNTFKPTDFKYTFKCRTTGDIIFRCNNQSFVDALRDILRVELDDFRRFYLKLYNVEMRMDAEQPIFKRENQESIDVTELVSHEEIIDAFKCYQTKYVIEVNQ